jgi:hypothetical protein
MNFQEIVVVSSDNQKKFCRQNIAFFGLKPRGIYLYEHKMFHRGLRIENTLHELAPKKGAVKGQYISLMNRGTSVGRVIRLRAGQRRNSGSILGIIRRIFYFPKRPDRLGGQPPNFPFNRWWSKAAMD